ncbi:Chromosome complete related, putative [Babesia ovata]|uniref:Chromosome complete related, putative n=1 Tax=Babesia ovata TaxID=189622 RepID=A0A2H6K712_9APIC|nr:Chromosome complete related, putative [Babesia ovata]GBE58769.1 Chromosome complete related, putative [Babesia ovata]
MADSEPQSAAFNGVKGVCHISDGFLLFETGSCKLKWSFSTWIRSEKSKKAAKVRLTFTEGPLRLTPDDAHADILEKAVIIVDFGDDRDVLERFCSQVSQESAPVKVPTVVPEVQEAPKKAPQEAVTTAAPEPPKVDHKTIINRNRQRLLETRGDVAELYQQLVETEEGSGEGVVSPEDFWSHHSVDIIASLEQPEAPSHLDGFIAVPPTSEFVNGHRVYRYNPELGRALLAEDETIRALHRKFVHERQYPEESFWKRILQSRHFYHIIGEKCPENHGLYDDIKGVPIKKITPPQPAVSSVLEKVDPYSDLIRIDELVKRKPSKSLAAKRFGDQPEEDSRPSIVDRFNEHAAKIINGCSRASNMMGYKEDTKTLEERAETERKRRITEVYSHDLSTHHYQKDDDMCIIQGLNMPGRTGSRSNSFDDQRSDSREPAKKPVFKMRTNADTMREISQSIEDMRQMDIIKYIRRPMNDENASRRMFILNTKLCQSEKITQTVPLEYDDTTVNRMRQYQMSIMEILQLYYKTLLPEEQKRLKLLLAARQLKGKLEGQQEFGISAYAAKPLQTGLMNQITAVEVYDTKLKAFVADLRNQAQQRIVKPK